MDQTQQLKLGQEVEIADMRWRVVRLVEEEALYVTREGTTYVCKSYYAQLASPTGRVGFQRLQEVNETYDGPSSPIQPLPEALWKP